LAVSSNDLALYGSNLLLQLAKHVRPIALKDLAKAAGMATGKAHL
jgi:hypothetical protein